MGPNFISVEGNLTGEPNVKVLPSGTTVVNGTVAHNRRFKKKNGEWGEEPLFIDIVLWEAQAEYFAKHFTKGDTVHVDGELRQETWQDKEGGNRRRYYIRVNNFSKIMRIKNEETKDKVEKQEQAQSGGSDTDNEVPF